MQINLLIGILGMFLILIGFILNEIFKKINSDTLSYNIINLIGAIFLIYYAYTLNSWPFLILNSVWTIVAIWKLKVILL